MISSHMATLHVNKLANVTYVSVNVDRWACVGDLTFHLQDRV